ncbi:uncharacterized protein LOC119397817 [Rhipicephalus sanguineus]|uniref:uncharacterized protein LOC119397817 n=1 Tax=Rhipicephalus sanguineus TaxID=34632 RepID=UPI0020C3B633|nr:uncharacterized protein LOC119397817 [Rhipicephalus sanguineus]
MPLYPARSEEELRTLEDSLDNSIIFAALVKELGQIGGSDVSTTTKRVMKRLLDDSVAVLYSYTGRKGKRRAAELNIVRLVFAAVRSTQKATDAEISHVIGDWLRFANARLTASKASKNLTFIVFHQTAQLSLFLSLPPLEQSAAVIYTMTTDSSISKPWKGIGHRAIKYLQSRHAVELS